MDAWLAGLAVKPLIGIALVVGLLVAARLGAWVVFWLLPDGNLKRELFRTSVNDSGPPRRPRLLPGQKADR